jgi:predicted PurR-regulated permease PerM
LAIWRFSILLAPLIVAVIIAYLLNPLVIWLTQRTRLSRDLSAAVVYVIFLSVLFLIPFIGTPLIVQQVRQLDIDVQEIADQLRVPLSANLAALDSELDVESFSGSVGGSLEGLATWVATVAFSIAEGFIWAIFIIVVGYYLLREANNFNDWVDSWIPPDFLDLWAGDPGHYRGINCGQYDCALGYQERRATGTFGCPVRVNTQLGLWSFRSDRGALCFLSGV